MKKTWIKLLLTDYAESKRKLQEYRATLIRGSIQTEKELQELSLIDDMISDLNYSIEWMRRGRRPGSRRGTDISDAYSRAILMDMDLLPVKPSEPEPEITITIEQKKELVKVLMRMSPRERQCFLLHTAQCMSYAQIGKEMKLSKRSVQEYITRAKTKAGQAI